MNKETLELLQQLAAKLGTTVDHLWAILLRQAWVGFWIDLGYYALFVAIITTTIKKAPDWIKQDDSDEYGPFPIILLLALSLLSFIFLIVGIVNLESTITKIVNPEYWALHQVLEAMGGK